MTAPQPAVCVVCSFEWGPGHDSLTLHQWSEIPSQLLSIGILRSRTKPFSSYFSVLGSEYTSVLGGNTVL